MDLTKKEVFNDLLTSEDLKLSFMSCCVPLTYIYRLIKKNEIKGLCGYWM